MTKRNGIVLSDANAQPAKCWPSRPQLECNVCDRRRFGEPPSPEPRSGQWLRREVVIDASAIKQKSTCGMWIGRPVAVSYAELAEAA